MVLIEEISESGAVVASHAYGSTEQAAPTGLHPILKKIARGITIAKDVYKLAKAAGLVRDSGIVQTWEPRVAPSAINSADPTQPAEVEAGVSALKSQIVSTGLKYMSENNRKDIMKVMGAVRQVEPVVHALQGDISALGEMVQEIVDIQGRPSGLAYQVGGTLLEWGSKLAESIPLIGQYLSIPFSVGKKALSWYETKQRTDQQAKVVAFTRAAIAENTGAVMANAAHDINKKNEEVEESGFQFAERLAALEERLYDIEYAICGRGDVPNAFEIWCPAEDPNDIVVLSHGFNLEMGRVEQHALSVSLSLKRCALSHTLEEVAPFHESVVRGFQGLRELYGAKKEIFEVVRICAIPYMIPYDMFVHNMRNIRESLTHFSGPLDHQRRMLYALLQPGEVASPHHSHRREAP